MQNMVDSQNEDMKRKKHLFRQIKANLYNFQLRVEKNFWLRIALFCLILLIFSFSLVLTFFTTTILWYWVSRIISILCFLFLFIIETIHLRVITDNRQDLDSRKELIKQFLDTIEPVYNIENWEETHYIEGNGDGIYERKIRLSYYGRNVQWYQLSFNSTDGQYKNKSKFRIEAYRTSDNKRLSRVTYESSMSARKTIIILDPPLSEINPTYELTINVLWPKIWSPFIEKGMDVGKVRITHPVDNFTIKIIAPKKYSFKQVMIHPESPNIEAECNEKMILIKGKNPGLGGISYFFQR